MSQRDPGLEAFSKFIVVLDPGSAKWFARIAPGRGLFMGRRSQDSRADKGSLQSGMQARRLSGRTCAWDV